MDMECTVRADFDAPEVQHILIHAIEDDLDYEIEDEEDQDPPDGIWEDDDRTWLKGRIPLTDDGRIIYGTLKAWRFAERDFTPWVITNNLLYDMDRWANAYSVGIALRRSKKQLEKAYCRRDMNDYAAGLIVTDTLNVATAARGQGIALAMLRELRRMHLGIPFYYAGLTSALEVKGFTSPEYHDATKAINRYYQSCPDLNLKAIAPRAEPYLLTAYWEDAVNPKETLEVNIVTIMKRLRDAQPE